MLLLLLLLIHPAQCLSHVLLLLFLFVGVLSKQFLQVSWNQAKAVIYDRTSRMFLVYATKPTRRAVPVFAVRVGNLADAQAVAQAAQAASAAPRLDVV